MRQIELARLPARPFAARLSEESAVLVELHDAIVAIPIRDEDVALRVPTHIRRPAENVFLRWRVRARTGRDSAFNRRRPAAEHHQNFSFRAELRHNVRAFVNRPDIVLRIHANGMRELETVIALSDFLQEYAVLVELPQTRVRTAEVNKNVTL